MGTGAERSSYYSAIEQELNTKVLLDHDKGRDQLRGIINGDLSFGELNPFLVTNIYSDGAINRHHLKGSTLAIGQQAYDSFKQNGALVFIPKEDPRFGLQWLGIYPIAENTVHLDQRLQTIGFDPEKKKFKVKGWLGPEKTRFLQCLSGDVNGTITFDSLDPFVAEVKEQYINIGTYKGKDWKILEKISGAEQALVVPKSNQNGHFWIEAYNADDPGQLLATKRIISKGSNEVDFVKWKGPKVQAMIDWAHDRPIQRVEPFYLAVAEKEAKTTFGEGLSVGLRNRYLSSDRPIKVEPYEDDLYKWLEISQETDTGDQAFKTEIRIVRKGEAAHLHGNWIGSARQRTVDYLQGKIDFSHVVPLPGVINKVNGVFIASVDGAVLQVRIINDERISPGDCVRLEWIMHNSGRLRLQMYSEKDDTKNELIREFYYNPDTRTLFALRPYDFQALLLHQYLFDEDCNDLVDHLEPIKRTVSAGYLVHILERNKKSISFTLGNVKGVNIGDKVRIEPYKHDGRIIHVFLDETNQLIGQFYFNNKSQSFLSTDTVYAEFDDRFPEPPIDAEIIYRSNKLIRWTDSANTPEENLIVAQRNIRGIVLELFPDFYTLFPLDGKGQIIADKRTEAEEFLRKLASSKEFKRLALTSSRKKYYPPDFALIASSREKSMILAFVGRGLFTSEYDIHFEPPRPITLTNAVDNTETIITPDQQVDGREKLFNVVTGKAVFSKAPPILVKNLNIYDVGKGKKIVRFAFGNKSMSISKATFAAFQESGELLIIPQEDERFGFKWIAVYAIGPNDTVDLGNPLQTAQIDIEKGRINKKGWYGPERTEFLYYLAGKLPEVLYGELPYFECEVREKDENIVIGSYGGTRWEVFRDKEKVPNTATHVWFRPYIHSDGSHRLSMLDATDKESPRWIADYQVTQGKGSQKQVNLIRSEREITTNDANQILAQILNDATNN